MKKAIAILMTFLTLISMTTSTFASTVVFYDKTTDGIIDFTDNVETVYAKISFISPIDGDARIFAASYDSNNNFIKAHLMDTVAVSTGQKVEYTTPDITLDETHTLRVFAWDNLNSMVPLCTTSEISVKEEYVTVTYKDCDESGETEYLNGTEITLPTPSRAAKTGTYTFREWTDGKNIYKAGEKIVPIKDITLKALWDYEAYGVTALAFDDISKVTAGPYNAETSAYDNTVISVTQGFAGNVPVNGNTPIDSTAGYLKRNFVYAKIDLRNEVFAKNVTLNLTGILKGSKTSNIYVEKVNGYPQAGGTVEDGERIATITYSSTNSGTMQSADITRVYNSSLGKVLYLKMYGWYGYEERYNNALQIETETINLSYTASDGNDLFITFNEGAEEFVCGVGEMITLPECTTEIAGRKFAGWSDGKNVYKTGAGYKAISNVNFTATYEADPTTYTQAQKALDGKKIMFIGNSYVYYGNCVIYPGRTAWTWEDRNGDIGYFYQLCRLNNIDVTVTNWCFSGHTTYNTFNGPCDHNIECSGVVHEEHIEDKYYDYVVISPHATANEEANIAENLEYIFNFFRKENPNVKFVLLGNHAIYGVTHKGNTYPGIISHFESIKSENIMVANWGKIWRDILDKKAEVPGATQEYNMNTFVLTNDGHHQNTLGGYITALSTYRAITGDSAVGQPYEFCSDKTIHKKFDQIEYRKDYYVNHETETNFVEVFNSPSDMNGLQQLVDRYIEGQYVAPSVPVKVTLKNCDEEGEKEYESGTELILTTAEKSGKTKAYTFKEWTDGENTYKAGDVITLKSDITLTAVWDVSAVETSTFAFDNVSYVTAGPYDETSNTCDNTIKTVTGGATGVLNINARNPYHSGNAVYFDRPFVYLCADLTDEMEAQSVTFDFMGITGGYGDIKIYQVEGCPAVGEEMSEGTLVASVRINSENTDTVVSTDITEIYNNAVGSKLYFKVYGWYGNDKRYTSHMKINADYFSLTYTSK